MGAVVILAILLALGGGNGEPVPAPPPLPPVPEPPPDDGGLVLTGQKIPKEGEPDIAPGPIDAEKLDDGMSDAEWLANVDGLVSQIPKKGAFWEVGQGTSATELAASLLPGSSNTGANRIRLIKCMTAVPWNFEKYAADAGRQTWKYLYDVNGKNLSQAWMPRHPSAVQAISNRENPLRGIDEQGGQVGPGGYYGLVWIPDFTANANALVCSGSKQQPPPWFLSRLRG